MPLLPIDLQVMFSRMDQVGKEQAIQKQASPEVQALQASELAKQTEQKDTSVNETHDVGEGLERVKEETSKRGRRRASGKKGEESEKKSRTGAKEYFKDPALGHHIDISG